MNPRRSLLVICLALLVQAGCARTTLQPGLGPSPQTPASPIPASATPVPTATVTPTATPRPLVPNFRHIVTIVLENKEFGTVIGNEKMPYFNQLAGAFTLLTQYYAVTHPSLPNYLAMIGGDTFGITFDCNSCLTASPSLPDQIESSGRTWKAYQEDMPSPCYAPFEAAQYVVKHNPFMYFKPIRLDDARCSRSIVPLTQLTLDIATASLPDYIFITPNECNDAHDCEIDVADNWLKTQLPILEAALDTEAQPYLIVLTWDEGQGNHSCCGLPQDAGGRIATVLISPQVKNGFKDGTPYTHYSLLKTVEEAWHLPYLGHAADPENVLIVDPWK